MSILVLTVPLYLQRPVAMAMVAASFPMVVLLPITPVTPWFVPLLSLKLLVAHLTVEAAFQPDVTKMANASAAKQGKY